MVPLIEIKPQPGDRLSLKYADGVEGVVDLSPLVGQGVFALWNDAREFEKARAARSAVIWNEEVDIDTVQLYLQLTGQHPSDVLPKLRDLRHA